MNYLKVQWKHASPNDPILLYSELDDARWEVRKVEVFPDGRMGYAGSNSAFGGTRLGKVPVPSLAEIAADPEFAPAVISRAEFEAIWDNATAS